METQHLAPAWSATLQMPINAWRSRPPPPAPFLTGWTWTTPARSAPALITPLYDVIICLSAVYFIPLIRAGFQSKGLTLESWGFNVSHCTCVSVEQSAASCVSRPLGEKDLMHVRAAHMHTKSLKLFNIINMLKEKKWHRLGVYEMNRIKPWLVLQQSVGFHHQVPEQHFLVHDIPSGSWPSLSDCRACDLALCKTMWSDS